MMHYGRSGDVEEPGNKKSGTLSVGISSTKSLMNEYFEFCLKTLYSKRTSGMSPQPDLSDDDDPSNVAYYIELMRKAKLFQERV